MKLIVEQIKKEKYERFYGIEGVYNYLPISIYIHILYLRILNI